MLVIGGLLQPGDSGQTPGTILIATSTLHESTFPAWWEDVFCLLFAFFSNIRPRLEKKREEFLRLSGISGNIKTNVQSNYDCLMRFWTRTIYLTNGFSETFVQLTSQITKINVPKAISPMNNFPIQPRTPIQTPQENRSPNPGSTVPSTQACPVRQPSELTVPQIRQGASALHPHATPSSLISRNISQAPAGGSRGPMTDAVKHALKGLQDAGLDAQQWQGLGLVLEVPYDRIKSIDTNPALNNPESKLCELLICAEASNLLLPERLVQAISELMHSVLYEECENNGFGNSGFHYRVEYVTDRKKKIVTKAQSFFDCGHHSPEPDCYNKVNLAWNESISPRDAYLIFNTELNAAMLYSLAARLDLPDADREALLPKVGQWNVYFAELLWRADQQQLLTFANLCAVIVECHNCAAVDKVCSRLGLDYHQLPAFQSKRMSAKNNCKPDQLLSMRDLVAIFFEPMFIIPEYLAQVSGYSELLKHPLMQRKIRNVTEKTMILLELIYQQNHQNNKDGLSVTDVVRILNKPEVMELRVANRLLSNMTVDGADHASSVFTNSKILLLADELAMNTDFKPETLANMLGLPGHKRRGIISRGYAIDLPEVTYDILAEAKHLGRLTPENLVYALHETCSLSFVNSVCNMREFSHLQSITGAPLPPLLLGQQDEAPRKPGSVPLTMDFLGNIPLGHNAHRIGMCMGLGIDELKTLQIHTTDKPQTMAYRLSKKLTETERGLETGHLYHALQWLDDQDALAYFPQQQTDEFLSCLPEQTVNNIQQGIAYISAFSQIPAKADETDWILPIASKIGLPKEKFDRITITRDPGWNLIQYLMEAGESPSPQRIKELIEWSRQLTLAKCLLGDEPSAYHCPISRNIISWPAAIDNKHTQRGPQTVYFERDMLFKWVNENPIHPLTNQALDVKQIRTHCPEFFEQLIATLDGLPDDGPSPP
ncbi:hypothetical protein [Endozoicomonas sp. SCSIO W0465]|uniref:hypothetical protein n=1 Tax=Endozoicomonas sp. SCSIO W0465 TaxID=2918516 RepID=UPI002075B98D|nr:hypothetical protein [Endozoicomonas sp. SCSIO W0465]USE36961.1 hypothetical protein MJO57_01590 [Endozoicomonas sp. SCSIO W0465]